jgi:hypothetical protein
MELKFVLIGAILLAICILPIILVIRSGKKAERKMKQSLTSIANQNNCQISQYELCGDIVIGLDEIKNFVFFHNRSNGKTTAQAIELANYQSCKIVKTSRTIKSNKGNYTEIEKLQLSFAPITKAGNEIILNFFIVDDSFQLNGELQVIEKWSNLINNRLNKKK